MNAIHDRYTRLAARLLAPEVAADEAAPDERRDAVVAAMALAIAAKRRRRRTLVAATVVAVAAAASIALLVRAGRHGLTGSSPLSLTVETMTGSLQLVRAQAVQPLAPQAALLTGDVVRAVDGSTATLTTAAGTHLTLSSAAQVRVDQLSPSWRFSLSRGQLRAQVAKLGAGERFVVGMPDGEVEVRGTLFRVVVTTPAGGCGATETRSTVEVDEGTVAVRTAGSELLLHPGETWASPCPETATDTVPAAAPNPRGPEPMPSPTSPTVMPAPRPSAHAAANQAPVARAVPVAPAPPPVAPPPTLEPAPAPPVPAPDPVSRLAEQNDLFAAAMAAERQGQHDEALRRLDALLERFPGGPLSESARAERQRILSAQTGR